MSSSDRPELTSAKIIISGGCALGSSENSQEVILPVADKLGAAVGASRADGSQTLTIEGPLSYTRTKRRSRPMGFVEIRKQNSGARISILSPSAKVVRGAAF